MGKREDYLREFNEIAAQNGGLLRAEDVVVFARDTRTALHHCFEWDDSAAAEAYRRQQARGLIRVMVATTPADERKKVRALVSLKPDRYTLAGGGYRTFVSVMTDGDMRKQLLVDALEEFEAVQAKYADLQELAEIFEAIERTAKPVKAVRKAGATRTGKYGKRQPQPSV